jgi:hypothetical protein
MKKNLRKLLILRITLLFMGCSKNNGEGIPLTLINPDSQDTPQAGQENVAQADVEQTGFEQAAVDLDLSILSSTIAYVEVSNIVSNPNNYLGKTIKMSGTYYPSYGEETGLYYHYVLVGDVAACCQQGMEFIWNGGHAFPDDYPKENDTIEVTGVFGTYKEFDLNYYYLAVSDVKIL